MCSSYYRRCFFVRLFQVLLILLTTCLLLVGLLVAGVGGILIALSQGTNLNVVLGYISSMIGGSPPNAPDEGSTRNANDPTDLTQLLQPTGIALVVIGGIMIIIALFGYCGTCVTVLIKIYAAMLLIVVVVETILVALLFSGTFNPYMKEAANQTLIKDYVSLSDKGVFSMIWNYIMIKSECCGLTDYTDFSYARQRWPRNVTIQSNNGNSPIVTLVTPYACCRTTGQNRFVDAQCAASPNSTNSNYMTGCWDEVLRDLSPRRTGAILGFSAAIVIQAAIALMALFVARNSNKINPI